MKSTTVYNDTHMHFGHTLGKVASGTTHTEKGPSLQSRPNGNVAALKPCSFAGRPCPAVIGARDLGLKM